MESSHEYVIHTQGLSKAYKGSKALDNLDLKVSRNSIFGFLGPNGAGKTTTIKLLLGLIRPSSGAAAVFGPAVPKNRKRDPQLPPPSTRTYADYPDAAFNMEIAVADTGPVPRSTGDAFRA
mgnify:CR=1 FL=1